MLYIVYRQFSAYDKPKLEAEEAVKNRIPSVQYSMCCNYRIQFFLVFCFLIPWQVLSSHFRGASITWKPLDPANFDGTVSTNSTELNN